MRPSLRTLSTVSRNAQRTNSTSFIGLGRMGYQMAWNLFSKQFGSSEDSHFVVCDSLEDVARSFTSEFSSRYPAAKISMVSSPQEATFASSKIITMLPSSPQVKAVYLSEIIPTLKKLRTSEVEETLCIDSTTLDVSVSRAVAGEVGRLGAKMIDAPVSGGVAGAKAGSLSFLVGGNQDSFALASPILSFMGQRIIHCGPSGSGLAAKICNNLVLGVQQIVVAEAMLLGQSLGLDPAVLASVINSSTGSCWSSAVNNPVPNALPGKSPPCEQGYNGGFATALMLKDMGLASEVATQSQSPLPLGEAAKAIYTMIVERQPELANKDFSSVYQFLKERQESM